MADQLNEKHLQLVEKISKSEGLVDYDIKVLPGSSKGDNFLGIIKLVDVVERRGNKKLNLVLKIAQDGDAFRAKNPVRQAYGREIYLYQDVFSEFEKLEKELDIIKPFQITAKCLGTSMEEKYECLILENLKESGFKLWNRLEPMPYNHVEVVVKQYARFHALSLALKSKDESRFKRLSQNLKRNVFEEYTSTKELAESMQTHFRRAFRAVADSPAASCALTKFYKIAGNYLGMEVNETSSLDVVLHGDCWCNNMLFKYEDDNNSNPTTVKFIDWQLSRVGNPILDIVYFLLTCAPEIFIKQNLSILTLYQEALSAACFHLGVPPAASLEELQSIWIKHLRYGLYMFIVVGGVVMAEPEDTPDMTVAVKEGRGLVEVMQDVAGEKFCETLIDLILFMQKNKYM